ncbi:alpha/beta hydrolase fold protein [Penicillium soppii]|uniref:alpha/beta hydrolase fold protein n=1 Tax=Penicillium soppii TaxID=69789 RepID=UPI0025486687|nr:alpha/beta hydrolase fold protein [Penicillium soppii]KAJ5852671.1 alpha/beta hydrolase fold protein [Penicillium soppii]
MIDRSTGESPKQEIIVAPPPLIKVRPPLSHRAKCFLLIWGFKVAAKTLFPLIRLIEPPEPETRPTLVKKYPCRPHLECRIFFPPNYESGKSLPVYLNVHGGGFAVCDAQMDDRFSSSWAKRTGMLVVALNYRKAPRHPFPVATGDIHAITLAVLADESLPIDLDRVSMGGFSAGGQLALSASQLPGLKGVVKAAITYYPIVDFSHPTDEKLEARPYTDGPKDKLAGPSNWVDWAFVCPGANRRDPLLSPYFANREDLPPWVYIVGAQWDMLRLEAQQMIHKLAGNESKDQEEDFEIGNYKWTLAKGCSHGFTHDFRDSEESKKVQATAERIFDEAHQWLKKSVLV